MLDELQVSQLKQQAAVAEAEVGHLRSATASPAFGSAARRPTADAGTATDAAGGEPSPTAPASEGAAGCGGDGRNSTDYAADDPGHFRLQSPAPRRSNGALTPRQLSEAFAAVAATTADAAHGSSRSTGGAAAGQAADPQLSSAEVAGLQRRLEAAEGEVLVLRAKLRQLGADHEAACAELSEVRGEARSLRHAVRCEALLYALLPGAAVLGLQTSLAAGLSWCTWSGSLCTDTAWRLGCRKAVLYTYSL